MTVFDRLLICFCDLSRNTRNLAPPPKTILNLFDPVQCVRLLVNDTAVFSFRVTLLVCVDCACKCATMKSEIVIGELETSASSTSLRAFVDLYQSSADMSTSTYRHAWSGVSLNLKVFKPLWCSFSSNCFMWRPT